MAVSATNPNAAALLDSLNAPSGGVSGKPIDKNQFLKLLSAQLKYQNPMDPMNDAQFVGQMAQFSTVEGIQQLNQTMASMSSLQGLQGLTQAASLLGKTVTFDQPNLTTAGRGVVDAIRFDNGTVQLSVKGSWMSLSQVKGIENTA
ncbi:MAG: flagellar hook capping FlgD N-terminal domain-containing protein [Gemmataceae bacterium]